MRWSSRFALGIFFRRRGAFGFVFVPIRFVPKHQHPFRLFATASTPPPQTFGQLVSSTFGSRMAAPSCPCCAFLGTDLFLPWSDGEQKANGSLGEDDVTEVVDVMSPADAMRVILDGSENNKILLVDTHGHPHLQRDIQYAESSSSENTSEDERVVSLTCAVSPVDWKDTLEYASKSTSILPALGIHPWYLGDILNGNNQPEDVEMYLRWDWLEELEQHLAQHPNVIVGEIGLCKMARFVREFPKDQGGKATALQLQKVVFRKQLEIAAKWSRPVTVHCVNMHGSFMEVLKESLQQTIESYKSNEAAVDEGISMQDFVRSKFPPAIAMHSFTGTAHHVQEILQFEEEILNPERANSNNRESRKKKKQHVTETINEQPNNNASNPKQLFYFGFSHAVNYVMCTSEKAKRKGMEAVRAVPPRRLLAESDVHNTADITLGTAGAVAYIAAARGEELSYVAEQTTINGLRYLSALSLPSQLTQQ